MTHTAPVPLLVFEEWMVKIGPELTAVNGQVVLFITVTALLVVYACYREHDIPDTGIEELAAATDGVVAADLELLVNRAAKNVLTRDGDVIRWSDFARVECLQ